MNEQPNGDEGIIEEAPQGESVEVNEEVGEPQAADWKAQSRRHEARSKKAQAELKAMRDQMSSLISPDVVADKDAALADAIRAHEQSSLEAIKYKVALSEQIPYDLAVRLQGTTEEEMREDAVRLKELVAPMNVARISGDARKATNPAAQVDPPNANDLLRQIVAGKR
jgi:hypothetical protein